MSIIKNTDQLIQQNNKLRQQLTSSNNKYYMDLLLYFRTAGVFYQQDVVETQLIKILHEIIEAQDAGISARHYFGEEPQVLADQIISTFPKARLRERVKIIFIIFGTSSLFGLITQLSPTSNQLNALPFLLNVLLATVSVQFLFWFIHGNIYSDLATNKRKRSLTILCIFLFLLTLFIGTQFLRPDFLFFDVPSFILAGIVFTLPTVFTGFTFFGNKKWRSLFLALLPFVWLVASVYFFQRYEIVDFRINGIGKYGLIFSLFLITFWSHYILSLEDKRSGD